MAADVASEGFTSALSAMHLRVACGLETFCGAASACFLQWGQEEGVREVGDQCFGYMLYHGWPYMGEYHISMVIFVFGVRIDYVSGVCQGCAALALEQIFHLHAVCYSLAVP